jgi:hypothetical protein
MDCHTVMEAADLSEKDELFPFLTHVRIELHLLFCPECTRELKKLHCLEEIMKTDFIPHCPDFEEPVMECLYEEADLEDKIDAPAGFSFRGWVLTGFFVLLSLSSSFFGISFGVIANEEGLSFLLPVGITIGIVLTCYGALFIASHLKELSTRFGLR